MELRIATWNVLADVHVSKGDYRHVPSRLLKPKQRKRPVRWAVEDLRADVVGLQEVDFGLVSEFACTGGWFPMWTPNKKSREDGCLLLVKLGCRLSSFEPLAFADDSGNVAQKAIVDDLLVVNAHIKWAAEDTSDHIGVAQTAELLEWIGDGPVVVLADCNSRPGGRVRQMFIDAGFVNVSGDEPTAYINGEHAALDLLATRGVKAQRVPLDFDPTGIPSAACPSDHIPLLAEVAV
jgi:endonuclease/exonuclease/phosphatase family metal-dependent hydrolase